MQSNVRSCHVNVERIPKTVLVAKRRDSQSDEQQLKSDQKIWFIVPVKEEVVAPPEDVSALQEPHQSAGDPTKASADQASDPDNTSASTENWENSSSRPPVTAKFAEVEAEVASADQPLAPGMVSNVKPCFVTLHRIPKAEAAPEDGALPLCNSGERKTWLVEPKRDGLVLHVKVNGEARPRFDSKEDGARQWSLAARPAPAGTSASVLAHAATIPAGVTLKSPVQTSNANAKPAVTAMKSTVQCIKPTFKIFSPATEATNSNVTAVKSVVQGASPRIFKIFSPVNRVENSTVHAVKSTVVNNPAPVTLNSSAQTASPLVAPSAVAVKSSVPALRTYGAAQTVIPTVQIVNSAVAAFKSTPSPVQPKFGTNIKILNPVAKPETASSPLVIAVKSTAQTANLAFNNSRGTIQCAQPSPFSTAAVPNLSNLAFKPSSKSNFQVANAPVIEFNKPSLQLAGADRAVIQPAESSVAGGRQQAASLEPAAGKITAKRERRRPDEKPNYKCEQCQKCFRRSRDLKHHALTHAGKVSFECEVCHEMFTRLSNLHRHAQTHAADKQYRPEPSEVDGTVDKPHMCDVCGKRFVHVHNLSSHARRHQRERSYSCNVCAEEFTSLKSLNVHVRGHESDERPFKCHLCDRTYASRHRLTDHIRSHSRARPFKCEFCDKAFLQRPHLVQHLRTHTGEKPYPCRRCEKAFAQISNLNAHMLNAHSLDKPRDDDHDSRDSEFTRMTLDVDDLSQSLFPPSELEGEPDDSNFGFDVLPLADPFKMAGIVVSNKKVYALLEPLVERPPLGSDGVPLDGDWWKNGYAFIGKKFVPETPLPLPDKDLWHLESTYLHNWNEQPVESIYVDAEECEVPLREDGCGRSLTPTYDMNAEETVASESWPPVLHLAEPTPETHDSAQFGRHQNGTGDVDFDDNELRQLLDEYPLCGNEFGRIQNLNDDSELCANEFVNKQTRSSDASYGEEFLGFQNRIDDDQPAVASEQNQEPSTEACANKSDPSVVKVNGHSPNDPSDKLFRCELCDKVFKRRQSLKEHVWTHTGQKPYKCDICEKRYTRSLELRNHIKSHTGEIPYRCHICEKFYMRRFDLKRHILTHEKKVA